MTFQGHIKGQNGKSSEIIFFFTFNIFYTLQNHFRSTIKNFRIFRIFLFFNLNFGKKNITPVVIIASDAIPYD